METIEALKPVRAKRVLWELWIWAKYSMFLAGIFASVSFVRVNWLGHDMTINTASTPVLWVPNAVLEDPTPIPSKKR